MNDVTAASLGSAVVETAAVRSVCDLLWRGLDRYRRILDVTESGDVLLALLYLRSLPSWDALVQRARDHDIGRTIQSALSTDDEHRPILRPLLDSVAKANETPLLGQLVELVEGIQLPAGEVPISQIFSAMLNRMGLAAGKAGGEFYTPASITELAAALLDPSPGDRVLDPYCRAGEFPAAIADRLIRQGDTVEQLTVAISDYSTRSYARAYLNLRLRGIAPLALPNAAEGLRMGTTEDRYDVVTANPPFNVSDWGDDRRFMGRWRYDVPPAHNANFAWLQYVVGALDQDGRAVVVMPQGASFSENTQERKIRAAMVEDGVVSAVISLPAHMFATTAIPVTLWVLQRSPAGRPDEVLFVDATGLGRVEERRRRVLAGADIGKIVETYQGWRERRLDAVPEFAVGVPVATIRDGDYRLNPRAHIAPAASVSDRHSRARQVDVLTRRLQQLARQTASVDQTIEARLREVRP